MSSRIKEELCARMVRTKQEDSQMFDHLQVDDSKVQEIASTYMATALFAICYEIQLCVGNACLSAFLLSLLVVGMQLSTEVGVCGALGVLLGLLVRLCVRFNIDSLWRRLDATPHQLVIHALYTPAVFMLFSGMVVPQTNFPVGILLSGLLWSLGWLVSTVEDLLCRSKHFYSVWATPIVIAVLVVGYVAGSGHFWLAPTISSACMLVLLGCAHLFPASLPLKANSTHLQVGGGGKKEELRSL